MIEVKSKIKHMLGMILIMFSIQSFAYADSPLALVYRGPGACLTCWGSAAQVAKKAGFKVKFVGSNFKDFSLFKKAKLWVQPGGKSKTAALAMGPEYLKQIRDFISGGGGYVGFCAGAFLSTEKIGTSDADGLGIFPGRTKLWDQTDGAAQIAALNWNGNVRKVYYHGGPFLNFSEVSDPNLEVIAYFDDGQINAARTTFGNGKVFITGSHPEASKAWKFLKGQKDADGTDQDLAADMMNWVTH